MRRRFAALAVALTAALVLMLPVSADVIWEPDNSFYETHREECEYIGRSYEVRGCEDHAPLFTAPDGMGRDTLENGSVVEVQFVWSGAQDWGYVANYEAEKEGWVPMDDLSLIYDSQQFMEDHAGQIQTVEPVDVDFDEVILYEYPNGPQRFTLKEDERYQPFEELFTAIYTDENGLCWGYVGYYMGRMGAWACLDDPMNGELSTAVVETQPSAAQLRGTPSVAEGGNPLLLPAVLVAAVAAVTVVLIRKLCPKRRIK